MSWTALVPLKLGPERKSRLAERLSQAEREELADAVATHVLNTLSAVSGISRIIVLAPRAFGEAEWKKDEGRGLNAELSAVRTEIDGPLLVIHGDLPLLSVQDVDALLAASSATGVAIAPDRHSGGTNAIALASGQDFGFAFGPGSHALHAPGAAEVDRAGLSHDLDTPDDLDALKTLGWAPPAVFKN